MKTIAKLKAGSGAATFGLARHIRRENGRQADRGPARSFQAPSRGAAHAPVIAFGTAGHPLSHVIALCASAGSPDGGGRGSVPCPFTAWLATISPIDPTTAESTAS